MSVDYRLATHFDTSRRRYEAARRALPEYWRTDPRPEIQSLNEHWVGAFVRAAEYLERANGGLSASSSDAR